jgi:hypothetical protein
MALVPSRHAAGGSLRPVDYLFESLDVDEPAGNGDDAVTQALEQGRRREPMVATDSPRRRRPGNAGGRRGGVHCYADHDRSTRSCLARHGQHTCHQNLGGDAYR